MKGILINSTKKTVELLDTDYTLDKLRELVDCRTVTGFYLENGDYAYADDEGLFVDEPNFVRLSNLYDPVPGNILILGSDGEGGNADCLTNIEDINKSVIFCDSATVEFMAQYKMLTE